MVYRAAARPDRERRTLLAGHAVSAVGADNAPLEVLRTQDARKAVSVGATAMSVSNHGVTTSTGRRRRSALPRRGGRCRRRGRDPARRWGPSRERCCQAVALGARAVMIGRDALWGPRSRRRAGRRQRALDPPGRDRRDADGPGPQLHPRAYDERRDHFWRLPRVPFTKTRACRSAMQFDRNLAGVRFD